jgi:hypothetical protein
MPDFLNWFATAYDRLETHWSKIRSVLWTPSSRSLLRTAPAGIATITTAMAYVLTEGPFRAGAKDGSGPC